MVDTLKSTRILTRAFTWFFCRTVPSSRNANPACIARTITAPSRMNRTSVETFKPSIASPLVVWKTNAAPRGRDKLYQTGGLRHYSFVAFGLGRQVLPHDRHGHANFLGDLQVQALSVPLEALQGFGHVDSSFRTAALAGKK